MPRSALARYLIFVALLFWLMAGWLGTRGHFCFDGKEPPISVHMELTADHTDHSLADSHMDADVNLLQMIKSGQLWLWALVIVVLFSVFWILPAGIAPPREQNFSARLLIYLVPPLRAPPASAFATVSNR